MMKKGNVYVIATPIGNLEDITLRAIDQLKSVDLIYCEDNRTSAKLLEKHGILTKTLSYHKFNEKQRLEKIMTELDSQKDIALISDAGTPCICDPGRILINELQSKGVKVIPIPGACTITTFLSAIPKVDEKFVFIGFLPRNTNQLREILELNKSTDTVFYESPNRLIKSLEMIAEILGGQTRVAIGRELTKVFEEIKIGTVEEIVKYYKENTLKGEIVGIVYGVPSGEPDFEEIQAKIKILKKQGFSARDISVILSNLFDINKNEIYKFTID